MSFVAAQRICHFERMEETLAHDLTRQLLDALRALPRTRVSDPTFQSAHAPEGIDAEIRVDLPDSDVTLVIETKKAVYPRDVRDILWQIRTLRNAMSQQDRNRPSLLVPLIAAYSISSGAKDILKEENVGYFDSGGSLFLPTPHAYVLIDKPAPKALTKSILALFRGKRAQVLHALLTQPQIWFGVAELADLAHVSPATASETLSELERLDWLLARGNGPTKERRVRDPRALLDEWVASLDADRPPRVRRFHVPMSNTPDLARRLASLCEHREIAYALTQEYAAQLYAPFLTSVARLACYLPSGEPAETVAAVLDARVVTDGANLLIIEDANPSQLLFREFKDGLWLASPLQVYLDLLRAGGRARDMAKHLRAEKIGF